VENICRESKVFFQNKEFKGRDDYVKRPLCGRTFLVNICGKGAGIYSRYPVAGRSTWPESQLIGPMNARQLAL
jgi:hypothetical protein